MGVHVWCLGCKCPGWDVLQRDLGWDYNVLSLCVIFTLLWGSRGDGGGTQGSPACPLSIGLSCDREA